MGIEKSSLDIGAMQTPEVEKEIVTKIIIQAMRHGNKEKDPEKNDNQIRLTDEGRFQADEKGKINSSQATVSVAIGSPKQRTQETAGHFMLANVEDISPTATLEEMEGRIGQELKYGKKIIEDVRLDLDTSGPVGQELLDEFKAGRYLSFLVNRSDQVATQTGDKNSSTYSRFFGNVAALLNHYVNMGEAFNRIVSKTDRYEQFGNQIERSVATHGGALESFVMKVLEETEGIEKRDEFIISLNDTQFQETEGIKLEIVNRGQNKQEIMLSYPVNGKINKVTIKHGLLESLIKQRQDFETMVNKKLSENADSEQIKENVSQYHDRFAGILGKHYNLRSLAMSYHEKFQDTVKEKLTQFANEHPELKELKVLEVGTGTGLTSIRALESDQRVKLVTVDADGNLMEKAKEALADMAERIEFINKDILSALQAMGNESIDAMVSALTIHNFPSEYREQMMKELARVLKSGGLFVNADKYAHEDIEAHQKSLKEQIDSFDIFDKMDVPEVDISTLKQGWIKHYEDDEKTKITEPEQIKMLENLGFKDINVIFRESMEAVITAIKK